MGLLRTIGRLLLCAVIALIPTVLLLRLHRSAGVTPTDVETWPTEFEGIAADERAGLVFIGVPGYRSVYVYSTDGRFVRKWNVRPGGSLWLEAGADGTVHVTGAKTPQTRYTYDANGKLVGESPRDGLNWTTNSRRWFRCASGDAYAIDGGWGETRVLHVDRSGATAVLVDRSFATGMREHPGFAAGVAALHAALTLLLFFLTKTRRPRRRNS